MADEPNYSQIIRIFFDGENYIAMLNVQLNSEFNEQYKFIIVHSERRDRT